MNIHPAESRLGGKRAFRLVNSGVVSGAFSVFRAPRLQNGGDVAHPSRHFLMAAVKRA
jgi:hypothetical protein